MKNLNLFGTLIVSAALLASSGCKHRPVAPTPIPGMEVPPGSQNEPGSGIGNGTPLTPETPPAPSNVSGIPIENGTKWDSLFASGKQDREKFAADTIYFEFDRSTIKPSEESKLQDVASYFKNNTTDALIVEGNCDERGTEKYNLSLGERRALSIREYLANLGMDPQRIKTVTYGASHPVDPGHNETAWAKNRRGDLVLVSP